MFKGFIFDLDGTIYLSDRLIPGADRVVRRIREKGGRVVFLTNKPLQTREVYSDKLTRLGIPTQPEEVVNSTLVRARSQRDDIQVVYVPANELAAEVGNVKMANVVLLGAMLGTREILPIDSVKRTMDLHIPQARKKIIEPNKRAMQCGIDYARR